MSADGWSQFGFFSNLLTLKMDFKQCLTFYVCNVCHMQVQRRLKNIISDNLRSVTLCFYVENINFIFVHLEEIKSWRTILENRHDNAEYIFLHFI